MLPKETMVLPGSGSFTSIATEALYNPEVGEKTKPSRVCSTNRRVASDLNDGGNGDAHGCQRQQARDGGGGWRCLPRTNNHLYE